MHISNFFLILYIGDVYMTPLELTASITALANLIAFNTPDNDGLGLIGAALTQLR